MFRRLSIAMYALMLASVAASADTPSTEGIDALEARIRTLEASSLALQEQTAATLAALAQAREQIVALQAVVPSAAVASSASAFNPALAPVGVLLAVLGYAVGTLGGWFTGILLQAVVAAG